jgi:hypothetical protein
LVIPPVQCCSCPARQNSHRQQIRLIKLTNERPRTDVRAVAYGSPDTDEVSGFDVTFDTVGNRDDLPDTFVAANVRELDVGDVLAFRAGGVPFLVYRSARGNV